MKRETRGFLRGTRGQSLVEFALILPMFLVVMFLITEFGRAIYEYNILVSATRMGARGGILLSSGNAVSGAIALADSMLTASNINPATVTLAASVEDNYGGQGIKVLHVTADKNFDWIYKGGLQMTGGGTVAKPSVLKLHAETIMQGESF